MFQALPGFETQARRTWIALHDSAGQVFAFKTHASAAMRIGFFPSYEIVPASLAVDALCSRHTGDHSCSFGNMVMQFVPVDYWRSVKCKV